MTETPADVVARGDVERLWSDAISGRCSRLETSRRAQVLLDRVSAENPVVNWGLHTLHDLRQSPSDRDSAALTDGRTRWRAQLTEYDADLDGWMREYFRKMVTHHAEWRGVDAARRFGAKLIREGHLEVSDVDRALGC